MSNDLPFPRERFCSAENSENVVTVPGFRFTFGDDYGMTIPTPPANGLLVSGFVVTDPYHKVIYSELEC